MEVQILNGNETIITDDVDNLLEKIRKAPTQTRMLMYRSIISKELASIVKYMTDGVVAISVIDFVDKLLSDYKIDDIVGHGLLFDIIDNELLKLCTEYSSTPDGYKLKENYKERVKGLEKLCEMIENV